MARKIRKISKPRTSKKAAAPEKKVTTAKSAEPKEVRRHEMAQLTYGGPSPVVRGHERKLSGIRTDLGAAKVTARDEAFIADIVATYGGSVFRRYDTDAGCIRRAIAHGFLTHEGGDLGSREAQFKTTDTGREYGGAVNKK